MFWPSIPSTHYRWSGSIQVRYSDYRSARPRLLRRPWQSYYYLALLGHISSSKAGFVQCLERREEFRRSAFFLATYRNGPISVGDGHKLNAGLHFFSGIFLPFFFCSHSAFPTIMSLRKFVHFFIFVVSLRLAFVHKIRVHGRRGKGTAESFSREKLRQAPQKEGGKILCDLPPV